MRNCDLSIVCQSASSTFQGQSSFHDEETYLHKKITFSMFWKTMEITTILFGFILLGSGLSVSKLIKYNIDENLVPPKRLFRLSMLPSNLGQGYSLNKQKQAETSLQVQHK